MTTFRSERERVVSIVAAVILDEAGRVLLVRKRGTRAFMLPGGKLAKGESVTAALSRELREELGCDLACAPTALGSYCAPAANEPGYRVDAEIFAATLIGEARACAEIEELAWHDAKADAPYPLAPLARDHVLPLVRQRRCAA